MPFVQSAFSIFCRIIGWNRVQKRFPALRSAWPVQTSYEWLTVSSLKAAARLYHSRNAATIP
jgi:hypothetical protein